MVGRYGTHAEALAALDQLANRGVPVEGAAIVARGLRVVEHVSRRPGLITGLSERSGIGRSRGGGAGVLLRAVRPGRVLGLGADPRRVGHPAGRAGGGGAVGAVGYVVTARTDALVAIRSLEAARYDLVVGTATAARAGEAVRTDPQQAGR